MSQTQHPTAGSARILLAFDIVRAPKAPTKYLLNNVLKLQAEAWDSLRKPFENAVVAVGLIQLDSMHCMTHMEHLVWEISVDFIYSPYQRTDITEECHE